MSKKATFLQSCVQGQAATSEIDDWVDRWHEGAEHGSLADFLGMSSVEYARWVANPQSLTEIIAAHREPVVASSGPSGT